MTDPYSPGDLEAPDEFRRPLSRSDRPVARRVVRPLERFMHLEVGGAAVLLLAAIAALVWANLSSEGYESAWATKLTIGGGSLELSESLRHWVNDGLMTFFFFLIALEVKRETLVGSLSERRLAVTPIAAAIGGMVAPALIYLLVNSGSGGHPDGWAVPIATDVAFALGVLALIGRMAPGPLRAFLLTVAIVDDVGTILIIAVFFSEGLALAWLGGAAAAVVAIVLLRSIQVRALAPFAVLALVLWLCAHESGVHATLAGVVLGLLTPLRPFHPPEQTSEVISGQLTELRESPDAEVGEETMRQVARLADEARSPVTRMEDALHPWTAFLILPLFALANAGVAVDLDGIGDVVTGPLGLGIVLGLVIGKPVGLWVATALAVRLTGARLPEQVTLGAVACVGFVAGIGFTVALFISDLAFVEPAQLAEAKTAILLASGIASAVAVGAFALRHRARKATPPATS
jgi:NhaA family Na+:H+ antiporter